MNAEAFLRALRPRQVEAIEIVAMDRWGAFAKAVRDRTPDADRRIAFDDLHAAQRLGNASDSVRRTGHPALPGEDSVVSRGSRYRRLTKPDNREPEQAGALEALHRMNPKTGRAWSMKETAMCIWRSGQRGHGEEARRAWVAEAMRSFIEAMEEVARTIRDHLGGIVDAMALGVTNAAGESVDSKVQRIRRVACGFRSRERFSSAILLHRGDVDLHPTRVSATHTRT